MGGSNIDFHTITSLITSFRHSGINLNWYWSCQLLCVKVIIINLTYMMFLKVMYDFTCINFMTVSQMLPLELAVGIVLLKFQVTLTRILLRVFVHRSPLLSTIRTTSTSTRLLIMKTSASSQVMS